jgi:hypothetical protein
MLAGGGMGKRAVRGVWFGSVLAGGSMAGTACCMTAGVSGSMMTPSLVTAGVIRSWAVSDLLAGVSRLARKSMTASLTTEYGKGLRRCRDVVSTTVGVGCQILVCDIRFPG